MLGKEYEDSLKSFINERNLKAEHLSFNQSCHSVAEAAEAVNANIDEFVKNICLVDSTGKLVVAIVKGEDRVSTTKVGQLLSTERPNPATADQILELTGYPCGGTPSFGYDATFIVDERVMEKEFVYTGGGSEQSLVRITPQELVKANGAKLAPIRK